jgi:hypothetical protein
LTAVSYLLEDHAGARALADRGLARATREGQAKTVVRGGSLDLVLTPSARA